jgi:hypothetical protein
LKIPYFFLISIAIAGMHGQTALNTPKARPQTPLPPRIRTLLSQITADDLRGDLSFLASDALQGRFTPSPGLDAAAEFVASRFRAAGLEPGGDQQYFQTARMVDRRLPKLTGALKVQVAGRTLTVAPDKLSLYSATDAAKFANTPALVFASPDMDALKGSDVKEKVVLYAEPDLTGLRQDQAMAARRKQRAFSRALLSAGAALEVVASNSARQPPQARLLPSDEAQKREGAVLLAQSAELAQALRDAKGAKVTAEIPAPEDKPVIGKNVIAILRGSDPQLKATCILLTAHYDHIGTIATATGLTQPVENPSDDKVYNGANDDGSGTVSVIEIARAFAKYNPHPKRSIVFMTFFGEERGELGSEFYGDHPVFPLAKTMADVNLEQVGRTDASNGKQINTASLTGYDYSDVTCFLEKAGTLTGVRVYKDAQGSDDYFTQSDNWPLAQKGVPAHSLTVAFDYPDYHGLGDSWEKIDYENMARVDRMIALGLLNMANEPKAPAWNAQNAKTERFRAAQAKAHP